MIMGKINSILFSSFYSIQYGGRHIISIFLFNRFNLVRFSTEAVPWKPSLVDTNDGTCQEAVEWVTGFEASGSTCTLDALQKAFGDTDVEGIYLLTDGKPVSICIFIWRFCMLGEQTIIFTVQKRFTSPPPENMNLLANTKSNRCREQCHFQWVLLRIFLSLLKSFFFLRITVLPWCYVNLRSLIHQEMLKFIVHRLIATIGNVFIIVICFNYSCLMCN